MHDVVIIGGGVIGLSLAYELARHELRVQVLERGTPGREASWAGAGILPPGNAATAELPYEYLAGLSHDCFAQWSDRLRTETGIDNGFRRCGGLYLARGEEASAELEVISQYWRHRQVPAEMLTPADVDRLEPLAGFSSAMRPIDAALLLPSEAQVRNPWHLQALRVACQQQGVAITSSATVEDFRGTGSRISEVLTSRGTVAGERFCLCGGAWSGTLAARLGMSLPLKPIRGQIVLLECARPPLRRIANLGARYLVPREDGRLLIGSTEEDVGFDKSTTGQGIQELLQFALELVPALREARFQRSWAGLRPATADGMPYLGPMPEWDNLFIAAGHFRSGLTLSAGTAVAMGALIRGQTPPIDLDAFKVNRK